MIENGVMGDWPQVIYRNCDFSGADVSGVFAGLARFEGCRFVDCSFSSRWTHNAAFIDCTFVGRLAGVSFSGLVEEHAWKTYRKRTDIPDGRRRIEFRGNDLSHASLVDVSFHNGIDLDVNTWPSTPEYVVVRDANTKIVLARTLIDGLDENDRGNALRYLEILAFDVAHGQRDLMLRRDELGPVVDLLSSVS